MGRGTLSRRRWDGNMNRSQTRLSASSFVENQKQVLSLWYLGQCRAKWTLLLYCSFDRIESKTSTPKLLTAFYRQRNQQKKDVPILWASKRTKISVKIKIKEHIWSIFRKYWILLWLRESQLQLWYCGVPTDWPVPNFSIWIKI